MVRWRHGRGRSALVVALAASMLLISVAQAQTESDDPLPTGVAVAYEAHDGSESFVLTVDEVIDPFESGLAAFDAERLASEGLRYIAFRLSVQNTGPAPTHFFEGTIQVLDLATTLHSFRFAHRDLEAEEADPSFRGGEVEAGGLVHGLLFFELPVDAQVRSLIFIPVPTRLIPLTERLAPGVVAAVAPAGADELDVSVGQADAVETFEVQVPLLEDNELPQPEVDELRASGTYRGPLYGHVVSWDPALWTVAEALTRPGLDRLVLAGDAMQIEVDSIGPSDDPRSCLADQLGADLEAATGFDSLAPEFLPPTVDGTLPQDGGIYYLRRTLEDGRWFQAVRYVECRVDDDDLAMLRLLVTAPARFWPIDRDAAAEVIDSIALSPPPVEEDEAEPESLPASATGPGRVVIG